MTIMIRRIAFRHLLATLISLGFCAGAQSASFIGQVTTPDGKPAFGAMVSVFDEAKEKRETVYTDAEGNYAIRTGYAGKLDIRARLANHADGRVTKTAGAD